MNLIISKENKILLKELKEELIIIKQEAKKVSLNFIIQLKGIVYQFLISYKEYSLTNIREYGLTEILMNRAMRFFKLDNSNKENKKKSKKRTKRGGKYMVKKAAKVILFPFYLLILVLEMALKSRNQKKDKKIIRNVFVE